MNQSNKTSEGVGFKVDTTRLQRELLNGWSSEVGVSISREERDLLGYALLTSNKAGFVRFFSYCKKTDFVMNTYETLHKKMVDACPGLKLDKKIRFFHNASIVLQTQKQIQAALDERASKPTPLNEICVSKDLVVLWAQHGDTDSVVVKHLPITNKFATDFSKSILSKAESDRFTWRKNKSGDLEGCLLTIETHDDLIHLLGDLTTNKDKNSQEYVANITAAMEAASALEDSGGLTVFFKTKRATADKSERKKWVRPEPKYYTLTDLKKRKWSTRLVEEYLGEPDVYFENTRNRSAPAHGYEIARVKKIEKTSKFKEAFQMNRKSLITPPSD